MSQLLTAFLADERVENVTIEDGSLTIERTDGTRTSRALTSAESRTVRAEPAQLARA